MTAESWLLLLAGTAALAAGAEGLVRGASRLAGAFGVSPLVVGLTVVAFGTSSPEIVVSVAAAAGGRGGLAFGNVVGSNVFNILVVLGAAAVITPLVVSRKLVWIDVPVMVGAALLVAAAGGDGTVSRREGAGLVLGLAAYTAFSVWFARREAREAGDAPAAAAPASGREGPASRLGQAVLTLGGLALLVLGSRWFLTGAVAAARTLGVSELVIGLTIVAAGTSLPEAATSVLASLRGERDIAVGNAVGSSIFNVLGVLGAAALTARGGIPVPPAAMNFDVPVMLATAVACLPVFFTGHRIARWEGFLFLGYYAAYAAFLVLDASRHDALPVYSLVMLAFVIPITAVTLAVVTARSIATRRP